ncbi:MAG: FkbM family methyltransferase [Candidatus Dormibacteraeota bacterium]|nr:FkbM family methyltransferase [Candidatus Dormibacteraeota bacterium]
MTAQRTSCIGFPRAWRCASTWRTTSSEAASYDTWEAVELAFVRSILRPGDVVFDIGANVGIFTLTAAHAVGPSGQVHAFEPVPANFERLSDSVSRNALGQIVLNQVAAGAASGETQSGLEPGMELTSGKAMSGFFTVGSTLRQVTVPVVSLDDDAAQHLEGRSIRLVKIDVEGYEPEVLRGMRDLLSAGRIDVVMIEVSVYALARVGSTIGDLVDQLLHAHYRFYRIDLPGVMRRWTYHGEPTILQRKAGPQGFLEGVRKGFQHLERNFNLIAIRGDLPAVAGNPRFRWSWRVGLLMSAGQPRP